MGNPVNRYIETPPKQPTPKVPPATAHYYTKKTQVAARGLWRCRPSQPEIALTPADVSSCRLAGR
jgi:hypothetical protein